MGDEIAISVRDVHVSYRSVTTGSIKKLLRRSGASGVIHAVNGVSFDVPDGQILGIVGQNGGGKSTLLKTIAGIFVPDSGSIDLHGHSCSLLSIGVGFIPNLSGRENIMLSGLLLGFSREEVLEHEREIIEYSELGEFIDYPVRTYSSGMYSKLAFSITVMLRTDILLVDEVLAVGDEHFKAKSFETMRELIQDDRHTVVIVSHSLDQLRKLCTRVLWLDAGKVVRIGEPGEVIDSYLAGLSGA